MDPAESTIRDSVESLRRDRERFAQRRSRLDLRIADIDRKLEAMSIAMDVLGFDSADPSNAPQNSAAKRRGRVSGWTDRVRAAVRDQDKPFTPEDLAKYLVAPDDSGKLPEVEGRVRKILIRLAHDPSEPIEFVEKGKGRKPTVYRRKRPDVEWTPELIKGRSNDETESASADLGPA